MDTERFRSVFDQLFDAAFIHDDRGNHLYVNRRACESLGYEREELLALKVWDLGHDLPPVEEIQKTWTKVTSKKPVTVNALHKRKDGSTFPVEIRLGPIDFDGETLILAIVRDISERKKAEAALHEAHDIINRSPAVAFVWRNEKGWPIEFASDNVGVLFGHSAEDFTSSGLLYRDVIHPDDVERVAKEVASHSECSDTNTFFHHPYRIINKDGSERWVDDRTHIMRDASGCITHYRGIVVDITEQRRAEKAMRKLETKVRQAQKLESLGILAGGIAHDFNNLLMGVMGNVSLVLEGLPPRAATRPPLEDIELAAQRAADLCKQMLAYSGRSYYALECLDLSKVVHEMAHLLRATVPRSTTLKIDLARGLPAIEADPAQLRQVIMNLSVNAAESMEGRHGQVEVTTGVRQCEQKELQSIYLDEDLQEGSYVFLEVTDDGNGMDERTRTRIFDPFFSTKFTGRGLGLAAVLGIVRGHHGALSVKSALGEGTSIRVLLPAVVVDETAPEVRDTAVEFRGAGTALLVDDDSVALGAARMILQSLGFDVLTATNGREALEVFRTHEGEVSFVLLDLTMPEMDGEETYYELLELDPEVRVIIASGYDRFDVAHRFTERRPRAFIQKPYKISELQMVLRQVLEADRDSSS